jgi:hypothetical protein
LIERRDQSLDDGLDQLAAIARHLPTTPAGTRASMLLAAMTDDRPRQDDTPVICLLLTGTAHLAQPEGFEHVPASTGTPTIEGWPDSVATPPPT